MFGTAHPRVLVHREPFGFEEAKAAQLRLVGRALTTQLDEPGSGFAPPLNPGIVMRT